MSLLSVKDLAIALPSGAERSHAIRDVTLDFRRDELTCIVGESGSGKSVFAHSIVDLLPRPLFREAGTILFDGKDIGRLSDEQRRRLRGAEISMIFQEPMTALNPVIRVGDQIGEAIRYHTDHRSPERWRMIADALSDAGLADTDRIMSSYPFQLSGGQRQRVMIAMGLVLQPKLLIADEPTTALDVTTQSQILHLIRSLQRKRQMSVIFITHDFDVVAEIADRVVVMEKGCVVEQGVASDILTCPKHPYTRRLISAVPKFVKRPVRSGASTAPVLEASGVRKTFSISRGFMSRNITRAVDGISLDVSPGECLGIVGESGSGKSTLGRLLMRLEQADEGSIVLNQEDITRAHGRKLRDARRRIQMVFQDPYSSFNPRRSVGEQIIAGPVASGIDRGDALARAARLLGLVGLDEAAMRRYPHQFSGGQRQRLAIARALAMQPNVVIADEPVSALDVTIQDQVLALFEKVRDELGLALVFITHDLRVAARMCDRIAVLRWGSVVELQSTNDLFDHPQNNYTKALIDAVPGPRWDTQIAV
jgi:peptide/nickel transport system ATP-binding protein